jgi:hypothetical protein
MSHILKIKYHASKRHAFVGGAPSVGLLGESSSWDCLCVIIGGAPSNPIVPDYEVIACTSNKP